MAVTFEQLWQKDALPQLMKVLDTAFPDPRVTVTRELVERVALALPEKAQESLFGEVLNVVLEHERPEEGEFVVGYYEATATHTRFSPAGGVISKFDAHLPMVRVRLPDTQEDISTRFGIVYAGDHRLYTYPIFVDHYESFLGWKPSRVELVTPARLYGARFGAIATYILFDGDKIRGYVLEAGMATGEPMVLYASKEGQDITRRAGYQPTPFSSSNNFYAGRVVFDGQAIKEMNVDVLSEVTSKQPIVNVHVEYTPVMDVSAVWPVKLTLEAAIRVAMIAERLNRPIPGATLVAPVLAGLGRALQWEVAP